MRTAFIGALSPLDLKDGWALATFSGEGSPLLSLVSSVGMIWLLSVLYLDAIASPSGTGLISTALNARLVYAMVQYGYFAEKLATLNKKRVPVYALILNMVVGSLCLVAFRDQAKDRERPFVLPFGPVLAVIVFFFCNLVVFWTGWETVRAFLILAACGLILTYIAAMVRGRLPQVLEQTWWVIIYGLGMGLMSYYSHVIFPKDFSANWWDILGVLIVSLIVFTLAYMSRLSKADFEANFAQR